MRSKMLKECSYSQKIAPVQKTHKKCIEQRLIDGYKEMSRINLKLAEEAAAVDAEALLLCEQSLRSVNECDS